VLATRLVNALRRPADIRTGVAAALAGIALFAASASLPSVGLFDEEQIGDTPAYARDGTAILDGRVPYRDFYLEYPPGALPVLVLPAVGDDDYAPRFKALALLLGAALLAAVVAALAAAPAPAAHVFAAAALVGVAPAALGPVFLVNYDVWPAFLVAAALAMTARERAPAGAAILGLAAAAKLYALVLLPLLLLRMRARHGTGSARRVAYAFAAALTAAFVPFAVLAPGALGNNLLDLARRPLQIESLGSSLLLAAHRLGAYEPTVNSDYNSQNLGGALPTVVATVSSLAAVAAVATVVVLLARSPEPIDRFLVAAAAAVAAVVVFGKILSPQFLIWLVPLVALVPSVAAYTLLLAAMTLTHVWFPSRYGELVALEGVSWVVLARNVILLALLAVLIARLARKPASS
jgi:uncharacterized membrane protein